MAHFFHSSVAVRPSHDISLFYTRPLFFTISLSRGLHTTVRGPNAAREAILSMMKKTAKCVCEKFVDIVEYNISRNNHIAWNVRPSTYFLLAYVASDKSVWRPWASHCALVQTLKEPFATTAHKSQLLKRSISKKRRAAVGNLPLDMRVILQQTDSVAKISWF